MADAQQALGSVRGLQLTGSGQLTSAFVKFDTQLTSGDKTLSITGFPGWAKVVNAWVTEADVTSNSPKFGTAIFSTTSVQHFTTAGECRIHFNHDFGDQLPIGAMVIFGPSPG